MSVKTNVGWLCVNIKKFVIFKLNETFRKENYDFKMKIAWVVMLTCFNPSHSSVLGCEIFENYVISSCMIKICDA